MIAGFLDFIVKATGASFRFAESMAFPGLSAHLTGAPAPPIGHVRNTGGQAFQAANPSWSVRVNRMIHQYPA